MSIRNFCLIALLSLCAWGRAEEKRVYYLGNSLTDELKYDAFQLLCESKGHQVTWGRHMIPGAPIRWLWEHQKEGFTKPPFGASETAFNHQWDVVTFQPFSTFDGELAAAIKYTARIKEKSPRAQVYVYAQWPGRQHRDWSAMWLQDYRKNVYPSSGHSRSYYEAFLLKLREDAPMDKPQLLIPVGHVLHLLHQKMQAGQVPGYKDIFELYSDGIHVSNVASYVVGCTFYACIFKQSPVGLGVVEGYAAQADKPDDRFPISPELARIIQETVWEVVASHPLTGVSPAAVDALKIVTPALPAPVAGEPHQCEIQAAFGAAPYKWSIAAGTLPAGLALDEQGAIRGTAAAAGAGEVTLAVVDSKGAKATRVYKLTVEADAPPKIATAALPAVRRGAFVSIPLEAAGGNGAATWALKAGRLPGGLELDPSGVIVGSTGEEGEFEFTIEATDRDAGKPESDAKALKLQVAPASADAMLVRFVEKAPTIDGQVAEGEWNLTQEVEKLVEGEAANNKVLFDACWDKNKLYLAVLVQDEALGGEDAVEIYIDGLNNREATYNFDDRRLVMPASGNLDRKASIVGTGYMVNCKSNKTRDGMAVELAIDWGNFGRKGIGNNAVVGVDILNVDDDSGKVARVVWRGTKDNATDPSKFGTLILVGGPETPKKK